MLVTVSDNAFVKHGVAFDVEVDVNPEENGFRISYTLRFKNGGGYIEDFTPRVVTEFFPKNTNQSVLNVWTDIVTLLVARTKTKFS